MTTSCFSHTGEKICEGIWEELSIAYLCKFFILTFKALCDGHLTFFSFFHGQTFSNNNYVPGSKLRAFILCSAPKHKHDINLGFCKWGSMPISFCLLWVASFTEMGGWDGTVYCRKGIWEQTLVTQGGSSLWDHVVFVPMSYILCDLFVCFVFVFLLGPLCLILGLYVPAKNSRLWILNLKSPNSINPTNTMYGWAVLQV